MKICLTREEVFYCHRGRHPMLMRVRTGVKKDGAITALHFQTVLDGGAYGSYGVASTYYTGALQTVTYDVPRTGSRARASSPTSRRADPSAGTARRSRASPSRSQLDKIACDLGLDPAAIRREHLHPANTLTANFLRVGSIGLGECIDKVVAASGWKRRRGKLPPGRGLGIACSSYLCGAGLPIYWNAMPQSGVQLKLDRGGGVTVFCGSTEIGQGSDTILAAIVAEVLGIDPLDIRIVTGDTDLTPVDLGSYSSRVTLMTGNAAIQAAERARELIADAAAAKLEIPAERVGFAGGRVFDVSSPENGMSFAEAAVAGESRHGTLGTVGPYKPPASAGRYRGAGVGPSPAYSYSAAVVEVEVDPETGIYTVPKIWIAHDVGKRINAALVVGQVEGSVYMGLGEAMMEEMAYRTDANRNVVHKFPSMLEYKSPTTKEMPEVETFLVEDPDPNGPFGAKEVGQGPLLPIPPAVANAVYDAVGVRVDEVPITPEKILRALKAKAQGKPARFGPERFPEVPYPRADPRADAGAGRRRPRGRRAGHGGGRRAVRISLSSRGAQRRGIPFSARCGLERDPSGLRPSG